MKKYGIKIGRFGFSVNESGRMTAYDYSTQSVMKGIVSLQDKQAFWDAYDKACVKLQKAMVPENDVARARGES